MTNQVKKLNRVDKAILVPTDFSVVAENAVVHALEFARRLHYRVCLLHVQGIIPGTIYNKEEEANQNSRRDLLQCKEKWEQKYAVKIDPLIREGNLFKVVNKVAAEVSPAMMVMGTHGKQGLQHLFGSHALRVVLDAACPVLIVQERFFGEGYRRVLLPVTGELEPRCLIRWALLFNKLFNSEIHLFQALEINPERNHLLAGITLQMTRVFQEQKTACTINTAATINDFSNQVIAYAIENRADMIMTTTLPEPDASGVSFSTWNERLMFNPAQVPVMFIDQENASA